LLLLSYGSAQTAQVRHANLGEMEPSPAAGVYTGALFVGDRARTDCPGGGGVIRAYAYFTAKYQ